MNPAGKCKLDTERLDSIERNIVRLRADFDLFCEQTNQRCFELLSSEIRKNYSRTMTGTLRNNISKEVDDSIKPVCDKRDFCKNAFNEFLTETLDLINREKVSGETIDSHWEKLDAIRKLVNYDYCDLCFSEVAKIFKRQIDIMRSLQIYDDDGISCNDLDFPVEEVVDSICEPIASKQRLIILRSLMMDSRSFTELSKLTSLTGGNLLFHIQKLTDRGMILQRNERGDYIITSKGYSVLRGITQIYASTRDREDSKEIPLMQRP